MTPNKQFNTYKEGLDLEFLREYCMEHGERRTFERGETLEEAGKPAQWVAYVERECFKYMAHRSALMTFGLSKNDEEDKNYYTGFASFLYSLQPLNSSSATVFVNRFISITCTLNGRKVMSLILG
jgi:hypothetical protein